MALDPDATHRFITNITRIHIDSHPKNDPTWGERFLPNYGIDAYPHVSELREAECWLVEFVAGFRQDCCTTAIFSALAACLSQHVGANSSGVVWILFSVKLVHCEPFFFLSAFPFLFLLLFPTLVVVAGGQLTKRGARQLNLDNTGKIDKKFKDVTTLEFCKLWNKPKSQEKLITFTYFMAPRETQFLFDFIPAERVHHHPMHHFGNTQELPVVLPFSR